MREYCNNHDIPYLDDPSNLDTKHPRNYIRHVVVPKLLELNPGIPRQVRKLVMAS